MTEGWHCLHIYYRVNQQALMALDPAERAHGRAEVVEILNPEGEYVPVRMQVSVVSGHRADFGLMMMDPDPLKIDAITHRPS